MSNFQMGDKWMYKNRSITGNNLCGQRIAALRLARVPRLSQRGLADQLQLMGLDLDKNAVQRIESGKRFVTDIELRTLASFFGVSADSLLEG